MSIDHKLDIQCGHVPFRAVFLASGQSINRPKAPSYGKPIVEFYDRRYTHTPDGQFVSNYTVVTLLADPPAGLDLSGDEPEWRIPPSAMTLVMQWLNHHFAALSYDNKPFRPDRQSALVRVDDDWYPSIDGPDGPSVRVTIQPLTSGWMVSAWGGDDYGLDQTYKSRIEAQAVYDGLVAADMLNAAHFLSLGFTPH